MSDDNVVNIKAAVEARKEAAKGLFGTEEKAGSGGNDDGITSKFVHECLNANKLGDGILYAAIHKDRYVNDKSSGLWYRWGGHCWARDVLDESLAAVEKVSDAYRTEAVKLTAQIADAKDKDLSKSLQKQQADYYKRIWRLREYEGRRHAREFAHTNPQNALCISGEIFDTNPYLLGCQNGVIDLRTGILRPGRPTDLISKASPVEWKGIDAPALAWELFISEIVDRNQVLADYLRRLFGYAISGLTVEHVLPFLVGQGRNGKGTFIETISSVLGPLAAPVQAELLLDQGRAKGSTGPSPDIMALKGLRMAFASETDEGRRISASRVKWLSGGDTLVGRSPYDRFEMQFQPTHLLVLLTNHTPDAPSDDFAFWERVHIIPFGLSFVNREPIAANERPADIRLKDKLIAEASGILAWLVRGFLEWQEQGLNPPAIITDATKEYQRDEDFIGQFISECCYVERTAQVQASALYDSFKEWWEHNISNKALSQKRFGKMMRKRFNRQKRGVYCYFGLGLVADSGP